MYGMPHDPGMGHMAHMAHAPRAPAPHAPSGAGGLPPMGGDAGGAPVTMRLAVPDMQVGSLVGKGGAVVKELIAVSGASIKISQKGENVPGTNNRIVTISGAPGSVSYAHMLVLQKVPEAAPIP
jgi:heterogeneous nuclear ribonucleoprotein K